MRIKLYLFRLILYIRYRTNMNKYCSYYEQAVNISTNKKRVLIWLIIQFFQSFTGHIIAYMVSF